MAWEFEEVAFTSLAMGTGWRRHSIEFPQSRTTGLSLRADTWGGDAYQVFMDGSFHAAVRRRQKKGYAGWGFVFFDHGHSISVDNELMSLLGPVVTSSWDQGFIGDSSQSPKG